MGSAIVFFDSSIREGEVVNDGDWSLGPKDGSAPVLFLILFSFLELVVVTTMGKELVGGSTLILVHPCRHRKNSGQWEDCVRSHTSLSIMCVL